ncbi:MAG TPA: hypothetical protein VFP59_05610 [Candidatus Angelobacter sp.]|nr:hypothetical protein [Candidatus Angelobacter sp.]
MPRVLASKFLRSGSLAGSSFINEKRSRPDASKPRPSIRTTMNDRAEMNGTVAFLATPSTGKDTAENPASSPAAPLNMRAESLLR